MSFHVFVTSDLMVFAKHHETDHNFHWRADGSLSRAQLLCITFKNSLGPTLSWLCRSLLRSLGEVPGLGGLQSCVGAGGSQPAPTQRGLGTCGRPEAQGTALVPASDVCP